MTWRCLWCGSEQDPALGVCADCGVLRGARTPGHYDVPGPSFGCRVRPAPKPMHERLLERMGVDPPAAPAVSPAIPPPDALRPVLIVPDLHAPFHSRPGWDLLMQVAADLRPYTIVIIGDFADFYAVSDHDKNPDRAHSFDQELDVVDGLLDQLDGLGATDKLYIEGNHEDRLRRYLMKNPALHGVVSTERLLKLKERGWQFVPYKRHDARGAVHFTHDVGASGRNAVFRVLDTYQHSVVSGHAHRLAFICEGNAVGDVKLSAMFGWLGDVECIDYMTTAKARKDWCLGFGVGYWDTSTDFMYLQPLPVVHGTVCFNGRVYRARAA